ncbi:MAG TPA: Gfo/Idh/MocA family oxidoreductase [Rhodothermales bacterium]|nr:Gfo/Idh/MocA family oxidoreductase [Rhodothermales bacterium]
MERIRWGILGTGKIAGKFAEALRMLPEAELWAVGSRSHEKAASFASAHGFRHARAGYEALIDDPDVDVVYVATPHVQHAANSLLCLQAGKAVLCEKPFALNVSEAEHVIGVARQEGLFLMEAMWMRFIPLIRRFQEMVRGGAVGEPRLLTAGFGFRADFPPEHRLFNPELGGGALLDLGVYPLHLASMLFGEPSRIQAEAEMGTTGVDEQNGLVLAYPGHALAVLYSSIQVDTPVEAVLMGTTGRIKLHHRFHHATKLTVESGGEADVVEMPFEGNGLQFEAAEVMRCLREGRRESDVMPLEETLRVARVLDAVRSMWGLAYPGEPP